MSDPLLSICIPTYNRAAILRKVLKKITDNYAFDDEVEIVISDNCSTDDTEKICRYYTKKFPNIKYFKNDRNLAEENFWIALEHGSGKYLKLINDYIYFTDDGLEIIKNAVRNQSSDSNIFFYNGDVSVKSVDKQILCDNLNQFITCVSNSVTFIGYFGIFKKNLFLIDNPLIMKEKKLAQVDWSYQLVAKLKNTVIVTSKVFEFEKHSASGDYNWFEIHMHNYYSIIDIYEKLGIVSSAVVKLDKKHILIHLKQYIFYTFVYTPKNYRYDKKNAFKIIFKYCRGTILFWIMLIIYPFLFSFYPLYAIIFNNNHLLSMVKKFLKKN